MIGEIKTGLTEFSVTCFMCPETEKLMHATKAAAETQLKRARWFTVASLWCCPAHSRDEALAALRKRRNGDE